MFMVQQPLIVQARTLCRRWFQRKTVTAVPLVPQSFVGSKGRKYTTYPPTNTSFLYVLLGRTPMFEGYANLTWGVAH